MYASEDVVNCGTKGASAGHGTVHGRAMAASVLTRSKYVFQIHFYFANSEVVKK